MLAAACTIPLNPFEEMQANRKFGSRQLEGSIKMERRFGPCSGNHSSPRRASDSIQKSRLLLQSTLNKQQT